MFFILKVSYSSCLFHASLALMHLSYWFSCSLCHVLIGFLRSCVPFDGSCHVSSLVCYTFMHLADAFIQSNLLYSILQAIIFFGEPTSLLHC